MSGKSSTAQFRLLVDVLLTLAGLASPAMNTPVSSAASRLRMRVSAPASFAPALIALAVLAGWAASSTGLFTVDEYFYARMAGAAAEEGAITFQPFDVDGAPALDMGFARAVGDAERLAPQYPSGYALIAAPFYLIFGLKGLTLLNALAGLASLFLTFRIARRAGADDTAAWMALGVLSIGAYWSTYLFAIWPHMLALALFLLAIERLLASESSDARAAFIAGLAVGVGQTIRIDFIVMAPVAILWLRLFDDHETRRRSLFFIAGAAPGFILASWFNFLKFGVFNPITYENAVAANDPADFYILGLIAAVMLAAMFVFDARRLAAHIKPGMARVGLMLLGLIALLILPEGRHLLDGLWYSLVDAQSYSHLDRQAGIERNADGWLVFYGFSKKALTESLPYIALLTLPLVRLAQGAMTKSEGLFYCAAGAFLVLYSFNETDSGLGLNARFLLPILPIAAIVSAIELQRLMRDGNLSPLAAAYAALAGAIGFFFLRVSFDPQSRFAIPLDLYPQLALAAALMAVIGLAIVFPPRFTRPAALAAAAAIGAAGAINASDFLTDQAYRRYIKGEGDRYAAAIAPQSVVFTSRPQIFAKASLDRMGIAYPGINEFAAEREVIEAYQLAGRCAYAQGAAAMEWLAKGWPGAPVLALTPAGATQGELAAIPGNPEGCPG